MEIRRSGSAAWSRIERLDAPICAGDTLRTSSLSRAGLFVEAETLVRVDQSTTVTLSQTADEIVVEFFQDEVVRAASQSYACGAGYFITRFPRRFRVVTPHLNAAVEGTEFHVGLVCAATELTVIEGQVLSEILGLGQQRAVTGGQRLVAGPGTPPVLTTLVKPTDAVQWVLYYPPLGDTAQLTTAEQCRARASPADRACFVARAETLLRLGRSDDAQQQFGMIAGMPNAGQVKARIFWIRMSMSLWRLSEPSCLARSSTFALSLAA